MNIHSSIRDRPLQNQVAVVTGAGRRIGRGIALQLAQAGAHVLVNYLSSRADAFATAREIRSLGVKALLVRADISKPRHVKAMFETVGNEFGRLDILVNNAAIFFPARWDRLSEEDWNRILAVNLKGTFLCAQAAARMMMRRGHGEIINISSLGGLQAWPAYMHYCASKAGVIMLTRCLAKALAPKIRVNSIAPGTIVFPEERGKVSTQKLIAATPLRKGGSPDDIARMVLFLAAQNRYITGQVFAVDGGKSIT
jgi:NAD(P)-dependent dehydrogenase (short-subunit alcohol dehydrogenase family)